MTAPIDVIVASTWDELDPGNVALRRAAEASVQGVWAAGGRASELSLSGPGEPIGHAAAVDVDVEGREILATAVEMVATTHPDATMVVLAGSGPALAGTLIGLARTQVAAVIVPGGPCVPGIVDGVAVTVEDVAASADTASAEEIDRLIEGAWLGSGAPPVQGPAATMAAAIEAMGICIPGSSGPPALYQSRDRFAHSAGSTAVAMADHGIALRDLITVASLENATAIVAATGGSPEALRHLLALAAERDLDFDLDRIADVIARTPRLADLRPHGRFDTVDFSRNGGVPATLAALLDRGLLDGEASTVTGASLAEAYGDARIYRALPVFATEDGALAPTLTVAAGEIVDQEVDGRQNGAASDAVRRSTFRALGLGQADLERPLVGIASLWDQAAPAGAAALLLGEAAEQGAWVAATTPRRLALHAFSADAPDAATRLAATVAALGLAVTRNRFDLLLGIAAEELGIVALMVVASKLDLPVAIAALSGLAGDPESAAMSRAAVTLGMARTAAPGASLAGAEAEAFELGSGASGWLEAGSPRAGIDTGSLARAAAAVGERGAAPDTLLWLREIAAAAGVEVGLDRLVDWADQAVPGRIALFGEATIATAPPGIGPRIEADLVEIPAGAAGVERIEAGVAPGVALLVRDESGTGDLGRCRDLCAAADHSAAACILLPGRPPRLERLAALGVTGAELGRLAATGDGGRVAIDFERKTMEVER
jgi:dihydroxyacid dehydratase/phosphogluconate dehydratase